MSLDGLDEWLYVTNPVRGCATCEETHEDLRDAIERHDASARFEAARIIHLHPHDSTGPPG
ncbi:hypothetical protein GCM10010431_48540 [Streptomyces kunmingensis]